MRASRYIPNSICTWYGIRSGYALIKPMLFLSNKSLHQPTRVGYVVPSRPVLVGKNLELPG